jgi:hypothetical protein
VHRLFVPRDLFPDSLIDPPHWMFDKPSSPTGQLFRRGFVMRTGVDDIAHVTHQDKFHLRQPAPKSGLSCSRTTPHHHFA